MNAPVTVRMYQTAEFFGVDPKTVRRWSERGLLSIHKRGRMGDKDRLKARCKPDSRNSMLRSLSTRTDHQSHRHRH